MTSRFFCFVLFFALPAIHAEDQIRSTQEELRRRNIFFGDIDGRRSNEYSQAVRRYQTRKGLTASGAEDRDTLRSLGLLPRSPNEPPPKELAWPAEAVLRSDERLDVEALAEELEKQTGVPAELMAPIAAGGAKASAKKRGRPPAARPLGTSSATGTRALPAPRLSFRNTAALPAELSDFVGDYLRALSRNRLADELQFYADRVDYFGSRQVDRRIIEQTLRTYYPRWPKRDYKLAHSLRYELVANRAEIVVTFRVRFSLSHGRTRARGETDTRLTINAATADPRIVRIEERRVRP